MSTTIGDTISRTRNLVKAEKQDSFLTDRFIYALTLKHAKLYIKRMDDRNKIMRYQSLFEKMPCVDLQEVDKVEACCGDIKSNCLIKRTKDKLPTVMEGSYGALFRTISSIDGSIEVFKTFPGTYAQMVNSVNFKYNKNYYYWYQNGYLYFPNLPWDAVSIEGLWEDSIALFTCDGDPCTLRQDDDTHIPEYLFAEIENNVKADLLNTLQIPPDGKTDNQNLLRD